MFWVYGDNVVKRGFPMVGTIIIAINILIYLLMAGLWRQDTEEMPPNIRYMLTHHPSSYDELERWQKEYNDWARTTRYYKFLDTWGAKASHLKQGHFMCLVTYQFIHFGFFHIFGNMLMMWALLGTLEITMGQIRFLIGYLLWGIVAGLAHVFMEWDNDMGLVGASGAIAGMVGAYVIAFGALTKIRMVFFLGFKPLYFMIPTGVYVFLWVLSQLAGMEAESKHGGTGVAWYCHAGGFALGLATMLIFRKEVLRKMIRNKAGDLQALDDEEHEHYEKKQQEKAEREGMVEEPRVTSRSCPQCNYTVGPLVDNCPMCAAPVPKSEAAPANQEQPETVGVEELLAEREEVAAGPKGIRPWHVILGISGLMLLAAAFVATRKEKPEEQQQASSSSEKEKKPAEFKLGGKPLAEWVDDLKGDDLAKRRETAAKLGSVSDPEGGKQLAALLAPALTDSDPDVRQLSAYILSNIKVDPEQADVIAALDGAIRDKKHAKVREYASSALLKIGQSKPEKIAPLVAAALADEDVNVKRMGVYLHQNLDPDGTILAPFGVRLDLITARQQYGPTKRVKDFSNFKATGPAPKPPAEVLRTVRYPSTAGEMVAYLTPDPGDGVKRPAVLWAHGGFNGIGSYLWLLRNRNNDQTASAFRAAGCVLMCPAWRNENDNPGLFTLFYDELDDLLLAREYLAGLPYVDPERIYLAGHDAGGTLVLLAAASSDGFRAIFSFGGAPDMYKYLESGTFGNIPFNGSSRMEVRLRSATLFAAAIRKPTFYFGGDDNSFGQDALAMQVRAKKAKVPFEAFIIKDGTHYDILDPMTRLVARKILADKGETCNISFTADEVQKAFAKRKK